MPTLFFVLIALSVAPTTRPAASTQPATALPDLSRLDADRLRVYALGLWKQTVSLREKLATAQDRVKLLEARISALESELAPYVLEAAKIQAVKRPGRTEKEAQAIARAMNECRVVAGMTFDEAKRSLAKWREKQYQAFGPFEVTETAQGPRRFMWRVYRTGEGGPAQEALRVHVSLGDDDLIATASTSDYR